MRNTTVVRLIFLLGVVGAILAGPAGQAGKTTWKGTVTTENGVKFVKNPAGPLYGDFAFDLKEDLRLGGDPEKEASYFPKGAMVTDEYLIVRHKITNWEAMKSLCP